jgi:hypothetical protein
VDAFVGDNGWSRPVLLLPASGTPVSIWTGGADESDAQGGAPQENQKISVFFEQRSWKVRKTENFKTRKKSSIL